MTTPIHLLCFQAICYFVVTNTHVIVTGVLGLSVEFAQCMFRVWLQEKDIQNVAAALKRSGVESKLMVSLSCRALTEVSVFNSACLL